MDLEKVNLLRRDAQAADLDELAGLVRLDTRRLSIQYMLLLTPSAIFGWWMGWVTDDWVSV